MTTPAIREAFTQALLQRLPREFEFMADGLKCSASVVASTASSVEYKIVALDISTKEGWSELPKDPELGDWQSETMRVMFARSIR